MRSQYTQSQADFALNVKQNLVPARNTFVFGILVILMQIAICLIYGFLVWLPPNDATTVSQGNVTFSPIIITIILFFMVVVGNGFGSLFSYLRKTVWSALGFNLLIVCLTIQWFFLIYLFWFKVNIRLFGIDFKSGIEYNNIWLTNSQSKAISSTLTVTAVGACLTQALKCALANCIAFSAILGRAGPLQCFFISIFGTIGFELNRAIVEYIYFDYGGTYTVFTYGGFMSLIIGLLVRCKQSGASTTEKNLKYSGNLFSGALSFLGACMLFAVFPIITADPQIPWTVNGAVVPNQATSTALNIYYNIPLSIWYAMSASAILGMAFSIFVYQKLIPRDLINGLIAGGVACCSAGVYFTNPVWPMVMGSACGMVQSLVQGLIEKRVAMKNRIFHSYSFTLFGVQGLIGGVFASIFRKVVETRNDSTIYTFTTNYRPAGYDLAMAALSAALGIGFGLLCGLFMLITVKHTRQDHFDDYTYWVPDDGIRYPRQVIIDNFVPVAPVVVTPLVPVVQESQIYVKETVFNVKAKHAYL